MSLSHDEKKEIIVEAAREVFSRFGYKKATIEDIAASLHRAKSSIYYYFSSKEDIFHAVIEFEANRARKLVQSAVDNAAQAEDKLRAYFTTIIAVIRDAVSYYHLMEEEVIDILDFSYDVKLKHKQETVRLIADILRAGINEGTFRIPDITGTAEAIMFAFDGLYHPFNEHGELTDKKFENLFHLILNGIRSR